MKQCGVSKEKYKFIIHAQGYHREKIECANDVLKGLLQQQQIGMQKSGTSNWRYSRVMIF
jgi:hypothetical protein